MWVLLEMENLVAVFVISATQLRDRIGEMLNRVLYGEGRVVIERRGEPVAAVISIQELRRLEAIEDERDAEILRMAKALTTDTVPFSELVNLYETLHGEPLDLTEKAE